jgi:eukaryotic-like serine/threonine-protein kinase
MTPEEWSKIKEVLQTALELDSHSRGQYLDSACAENGSMRGEVESLLQSYEQDEAFLELPAAIEAAELVVNAAPAAWIGRRLGSYQLLDEIGEGGMGAVYRAVRADGMFEKQVAVKLIRRGLSTDFFVSRFKNERQILAGLQHPNIASLLDGGVTEEGLPYVVLEFVAGVPIDEYCVRHDLSITDRLRLFRTVCSAVQYAHQNLIVHRDLKPGNILVTEDGVPKLLDFGIAKILDPGEEDTSRDRTLTVMRIMTPDFASPEQVRGDPITTSSDIYSLGVILYVLLAGRRPYRIPSTAPHEIVKAICDTDPEKPSTAVTRFEKPEHALKLGSRGSGKEQTDIQRKKLHRALSGDLDNIVLMALRKEPARRYATVEQFSEDVRRHVEHLPVIARKDTPGYRASRFVIRHKASVAATVVVAFTLVAALLITLREARIAQRRFNDVRSLANSLIFDVHDSIKDLPGSTPARKIIVDRALQYLNALNQESGSDLSLQRELATAYERVGLVQGHYLQNSLGDTQGSLINYQKALAIRERVDAKSGDWNDRLALAQAHRLVANQQWATGNNGDAAMNIATAVAISEALSIGHPKNLKILHELSFDYEVAGDIPAGSDPGGAKDSTKQDENYHKAIATDELMLALSPDDFDVQHAYATDLNHLGGVLIYGENDLTGGLACYKKELEIDQRLRQRSTETRYARGVAVAYSHIGQTYDKLGDAERSLESYTQGLQVSKELVLADPQNALFQQGLAIAYANTANELSKMGRDVQSLDYIEKSDQIMRALVAAAPENKQQRGTFAAIVAANGASLMKIGKLDGALKDFKEARASFESLRKTDSADRGISVQALSCTERMGEVASRAGNFRLAAEYFQQVLKQVEPELAKLNPDPSVPYLAADCYSGLGDLELHKARQSQENTMEQQESWAEARAWYLKSLDAWRKIEHPLSVAPSGFDVGNPTVVRRNLEFCEARIRGAEHSQSTH